MIRPRPNKQPAKKRGFTWGRITHKDGPVVYHLFRRDQRGAIHALRCEFDPREPRGYVIRELRRTYRDLRDKVDEIDLAMMETTT